MLYYVILYYIILYYIILFYIILYYNTADVEMCKWKMTHKMVSLACECRSTTINQYNFSPQFPMMIPKIFS